MSFELVKTTNFIRAAKKLAKNNPNFLIELNQSLVLLSENPFDKKLKTHKLKGELQDYWACSINFELRLIFQFVEKFNKESEQKIEVVLLATVGSHDVVY